MNLGRSTLGQRQGRNIYIAAGICLVVVCAVVAAWYVWSARANNADSDRYQLVTLSSGEHYIGKLSKLGSDYLILDNVYYQQNDTKESSKSSDTNDQITVLRLSDSVAKPDNTMHIASDKVVHWENLSNDSKIVRAIAGTTGNQ